MALFSHELQIAKGIIATRYIAKKGTFAMTPLPPAHGRESERYRMILFCSLSSVAHSHIQMCSFVSLVMSAMFMAPLLCPDEGGGGGWGGQGSKVSEA